MGLHAAQGWNNLFRHPEQPPCPKRDPKLPGEFSGANPRAVARELAIALDAGTETATLSPPIFALIVYRLGQEILNLQSGVRFPVGALFP